MINTRGTDFASRDLGSPGGGGGRVLGASRCCALFSPSSHSFWFDMLQLSASRVASCRASLGEIDFSLKTCSFLVFQTSFVLQNRKFIF